MADLLKCLEYTVLFALEQVFSKLKLKFKNIFIFYGNSLPGVRKLKISLFTWKVSRNFITYLFFLGFFNENFVNFKKSFLYGRIWRRPLGGGENIMFSNFVWKFIQSSTIFGYMCTILDNFCQTTKCNQRFGVCFYYYYFFKSRSTLNSHTVNNSTKRGRAWHSFLYR